MIQKSTNISSLSIIRGELQESSIYVSENSFYIRH
jgi:hypothetical protein